MSSSPRLRRALTPRLNRYIPRRPFAKQAAFLLLPHAEALYGGAAGGGKTDALLMSALQYVDVPGYSAILFRRTFPQLRGAKGLMTRAQEWLGPTDARQKDGGKTWVFPSGAMLRFGHLQHDKSAFDYQGDEFHYIGFDELTHFSEFQYTYLMSRLRRTVDTPIPLRVRAGSNPGGLSHAFVKRRFLIEDEADRVFVKALLEDNPFIDTDEYDAKLRKLGEVNYQRLRWGNWDIEAGAVFDRAWFDKVVSPDRLPADLQWVRFWDIAATEKKKNDASASLAAAYGEDGTLYLRDGIHGRWRWPDLRAIIIATAASEEHVLDVGVEAPGIVKMTFDDLASDKVWLRRGLHQMPVKGDKMARANPWANKAATGRVVLVEGAWISSFLDEVVAFDGSGQGNDDWVDAASGCTELLAEDDFGDIDIEVI